MARVDKEFDAVRMMRSIRARISEEMRGMTFEERQAYIQERLGDEHSNRFGGSRAETSPEPSPSPELDMNFD